VISSPQRGILPPTLGMFGGRARSGDPSLPGASQFSHMPRKLICACSNPREGPAGSSQAREDSGKDEGIQRDQPNRYDFLRWNCRVATDVHCPVPNRKRSVRPLRRGYQALKLCSRFWLGISAAQTAESSFSITPRELTTTSVMTCCRMSPQPGARSARSLARPRFSPGFVSRQPPAQLPRFLYWHSLAAVIGAGAWWKLWSSRLGFRLGQQQGRWINRLASSMSGTCGAARWW